MRTRIKNILYLLLVIGIITSCSKKYHLSDASEDRYYLSGENGLPEDEEINKIIAPYKEELDKIMSEQVGIASQIMYRDRPESLMGNWFVDIFHDEAQKLIKEKLDFSIQNYGGLRVKALSPGPVTIGEIFEMMPFENEIVILEARGVTIKRLFSHIARKGGWPVSSHVKVRVKRDGTIKYVKINGIDVDPTAVYRFALPDYIANGGDNTDFLDNLERINTGVKIRDAVIEHLRASGADSIEESKIEKRFTYIQ